MLWIYLIFAIVAMWYPTPTRDNLVWLIWLAPAVLALEAWRTKTSLRLERPSIWGWVFIGLCAINLLASLYPSRGLILFYRPLLGLYILMAFSLSARRDRSLKGIIRGTGALVLIMGIAVISATQWTDKSANFFQIIRLFPQWQGFELWIGGFNPNEIAGAITWLMPVGLVLLRTERGIWRWTGLAGVLLAVSGLLLGRSLSGLMGAVAGLLIVMVPGRWWPRIAGAVMSGVVAVNLLIVLLPNQSAVALATISGRPDVSSLDHRGVIWERAQRMVADAPWTGVGIAMFRQLRAEYPTPGYEHALLPHPHNEMLQFATDFGIPGIVMWLLLYLAAAPALWRASLSNQRLIRLLAKGVAAGLVGHAVYGLTDAIPVWDRMGFIFWWLLGIAGALEVLTTEPSKPESAPDSLAPG
jgi:O-antigen ligase